MPDIDINGGRVVYEFVGPEGGDVVVLTPGGRFSKDVPGVRPLAEALAAGGKRVLLWDRPNCGASDVQISGRSESHMRADTLAVMVDKLGVGPVVAAGGSGGARDSIIFAIEYPELVSKLITWSIVGGVFSTLNLASIYILNEIRTVRASGIEGVMELGSRAGGWAEVIERNPRNRQRVLDLGAEEFERVMVRWLDAFVPKPGYTIPGVADWEMASITAPTLIIRGGAGDHDHPERTSYEVHLLIKSSRLIEPPWPEDAWEQAVKATRAGTGFLFDPWVQGAPAMLEFIDER